MYRTRNVGGCPTHFSERKFPDKLIYRQSRICMEQCISQPIARHVSLPPVDARRFLRKLHAPLFRFAPVAQLDRASDYGSEGLKFESSRVRSVMKLPAAICSTTAAVGSASPKIWS